MNGAFSYTDIQNMSIPEFREWQNLAIDTQKKENRKREQYINNQKNK